ncbi:MULTISPECIES: PRC-barrel domain containing protein [Streptomyces]|uniref:PRC domain containing protein n=1 Tax=Streptomyces venezuelae TaxID=54571 RepID=A0A5P2BJN8_STRVZ|nr:MULTISPECIES: PRC-barrel domain containing protein [Streptomyces]NEA02322.1 PRC-barrel domain containing protein [Streptomyces sp. SID10116]MYY79939.1 PRC-barrel domain containing protein [Streptomyces sp. SID335]MYZ12716.1 PRC-barrel domain containing protein [Streptomyces sp. SID337]NDZ88256.1 PRC-barrel domain containing protein [Streptomyces sp. SID10115]NEB50641.1 PRC-barrel domain containing protein [Streptomyces sp. SID339]
MTDRVPAPGSPHSHVSVARLLDCAVEGSDGPIGKVDPVSEEVAPDHIVVDTGGTLLSKKVLLPLWVVSHVDEATRTVHVPHTKDHVRDAPRFDRDLRVTDPSYRARIDAHYATQPGG